MNARSLETPLLSKLNGVEGIEKLSVYREHGGYHALHKAIGTMDRGQIIDELTTSNVRGRGGAGFPLGRKASFMPHGDMARYLCCNADESEPGAFKDRELMHKNPHQLIEGIIILAYAIEASRAFIYIRGEYEREAEILNVAVSEAYEAGLLGDRVLGSDFDLELVVHRGAGAYICGEETALMDSLEGKRGNPRLKPPFPANAGLYQGPTEVNNVETLSTIPHVIAHGGEWYAKYGTGQSQGTKIVSVSGCVTRPGNYEIELGKVTCRQIIFDLAGGPANGRKVKFFFPGGSSTPVLTAGDLDLGYDYETLQGAGSALGSGSVIVIDDSVSTVQIARRTAEFYRHESCGKCSPCREGTMWTVNLLRRIEDGTASRGDLELVRDLQDRIQGHCLCVLGDAMAMPVRSMLEKFSQEFEACVSDR